MKRILAVMSCATLLGALAACGTSSGDDGDGGGDSSSSSIDPRLEELYQAAKEEGGGLSWYDQFVPDNEAQIIAAWQDTFPDVELKALRLTGGEASQRFAAESEAGATTADVLTQTQQGFADDALEKGWALELTDELIPTLADIDEQYKSESEVVNAIGPIRLLINTDVVDETPTSWEDLLDPVYKDNIIVADPRTILPWMTLFDVLYQEYGPEFLEGLADQGFQVVESAVPGSQSLAAGEGAALIPSLDSVSAPLIAEGAPVESVVLSPTTGVENTSMINANAEHPAAARLFVAWLLTEEGQAAVNGNSFGASPLGDGVIDGALELGDDYQSPDGESAVANTPAITEALGLD